MNKTVFINGSPKRNRAVSEKYLEILKDGFSDAVEVEELYVYAMEFNGIEFEKIINSDAVVMALPLYVDSVPAGVIEFMRAFRRHAEENEVDGPSFHFIINCGFMEHEQNDTAIRILKKFAEKAGFKYGGGISIGSGAMILGTDRASELKALIRKMAVEIENRNVTTEAYAINVDMQKEKFREVFNQVWIDVAEKKGLSEENLKRKYYADVNS